MSPQHCIGPPSSADPKVRDQALRIIERQIQAAVLLGTDAVLVVPGLVKEQTPYYQAYSLSVEVLQQAAPKAAAANVKIGCSDTS